MLVAITVNIDFMHPMGDRWVFSKKRLQKRESEMTEVTWGGQRNLMQTKAEASMECKPASTSQTQIQTRTGDQRERRWVDEKTKWSGSGGVQQRGKRQRVLRCIWLHPAMIRVCTGWFISPLQYWVPKKRHLCFIELLRVLFWKENVICGCGYVGVKDWPSDVAIMQLKMSLLICTGVSASLIAVLFSPCLIWKV